jgi:hypothetical protein
MGTMRSRCRVGASVLALSLAPTVARAQTPASPDTEPIEIEAAPTPPPQQPPPQVAPVYQQPSPVYRQPPPGYYYPQVYVPPPRPTGPPPPLPRRYVTFDATVGVTIVVDSDYNRASRTWGFNGMSDMWRLGLDMTFPVHRFLALGVNLGFSQGSAGQAVSDRAELLITEFEVNAVGRLGYPITTYGGWLVTPAVQLEVGGAGAWAALRGQMQSTAMPRFAALAVLSARTRWVGIHLRVGYQRAVWSNAGGMGVDLSFEGLTMGIGLEVAL